MRQQQLLHQGRSMNRRCQKWPRAEKAHIKRRAGVGHTCQPYPDARAFGAVSPDHLGEIAK